MTGGISLTDAALGDTVLWLWKYKCGDTAVATQAVVETKVQICIFTDSEALYVVALLYDGKYSTLILFCYEFQ